MKSCIVIVHSTKTIVCFKFAYLLTMDKTKNKKDTTVMWFSIHDSEYIALYFNEICVKAMSIIKLSRKLRNKWLHSICILLYIYKFFDNNYLFISSFEKGSKFCFLKWQSFN